MSQSSGLTVPLYLGCQGEHEPFSKGLVPDARTEARRPDRAAFLQLQGEGESVTAAAGVGVVNVARAQPAGDRATGGRVDRNRTSIGLEWWINPASVFQDRLVTQAAGSRRGGVAPGPGAAGVRLAGW